MNCVDPSGEVAWAVVAIGVAIGAGIEALTGSDKLDILFGGVLGGITGGIGGTLEGAVGRVLLRRVITGAMLSATSNITLQTLNMWQGQQRDYNVRALGTSMIIGGLSSYVSGRILKSPRASGANGHTALVAEGGSLTAAGSASVGSVMVGSAAIRAGLAPDRKSLGIGRHRATAARSAMCR